MAGFFNFGLENSILSNSSKFGRQGTFAITPVRIKYVFLDLEAIKRDIPELYDLYGGYASLGGVLFDSVTNPVSSEKTQDKDYLLSQYTFAKPLFPNYRQVPLINEIAYIMSMPTVDIQDPYNIDLNKTEYYYFLPVNLWNSVHHNALPDPSIESKDNYGDGVQQAQLNDYEQSGAGVVRKVQDGSTEIFLGNTFQEKSNIKNLQPYEGDVIFEGRWGNSLRFGSTVTGSLNGWSVKDIGNEGDPITLLRNGQGSSNTDAWIPTYEDINKDPSSIWMTSTQQIKIDASSTTYDSYTTAPTKPNEYSESQVISNASRILLNSTSDHILLSSNQSVGLNAVNSVNIDAPTSVLQSQNVYLGSKDATEPILLGDTTISILSDLTTQLLQLATALQTIIPQAGPAVNPFVTTAFIPELNKIKTQLETQTKSKVSKTI